MAITSRNPPVPSNSVTRANQGQRLLGLVRSLENNSSDDETDVNSRLDDTIDLFNNLIEVCSRWGILEGDKARAQSILASSSTTTKASSSKDTNKRGAKKGMNSGDLQIHSGHQDDFNNNAGSGAMKDEELVMSAILRILGNGGGPALLEGGNLLLVQCACELLVAMSERIKTTPGSDECAPAEYELLAHNGKQILSFLAKILNCIHDNLRDQSPSQSGTCIAGVPLDDSNHVRPLVSCLKATSSLVTLFGTKLSRSPALLADLRNASWRLITSSDDDVQRYASRLLAVIPYAGSTDRKTPSDLWSLLLSDIITAILRMVEAMAPLTKSKETGTNTLSADTEAVLQTWLDFIRQDISSEKDRTNSFTRILRGLSCCFECMFDMEGSFQGSQSPLLEAKVNVDDALSVIERFLSFPLSAESIFYRTKKRLRGELVDGGLLSPTSLASQMASEVKCLGHDILESLVASIDGRVLLPYARRIIRMSYAAVLTSCSGSLRKAVDPSNSVQLDGKKRRWLQTSVPLRTRSIESFREVALTFGSDKKGASSSSSGCSPRDSSDLEQTLVLICGCIVEQLSWKVPSGDVEKDWGSFEERQLLMSAAMETLSAILSGSSGIVSKSARALVDSVATSALNACHSFRENQVLDCSLVRKAVLNLGVSCVSNPWPDGSLSPMVNDVASFARYLETDPDAEVVSLAKVTTSLCSIQRTPRAPPLLFVSRSTPATASRDPLENLSAAAIAGRLDSVNEQLAKMDQTHAKNTDANSSEKEKEPATKKAKTENKEQPEQNQTERSKQNTDDTASNAPAPREEEKANASSSQGLKVEKATETPQEEKDDIVMEELTKGETEESQRLNVADTPEIATEMNQDSEDEMVFPGIVADGPDSDDE